MLEILNYANPGQGACTGKSSDPGNVIPRPKLFASPSVFSLRTPTWLCDPGQLTSIKDW